METLVWGVWGALVAYTLVGWILERLGVLDAWDDDREQAAEIAYDAENGGVIAQPGE